jgi:hypothetical protein
MTKHFSAVRWVNGLFREILRGYFDGQKFWPRRAPQVGILLGAAWGISWILAEAIDIPVNICRRLFVTAQP